MLELCTELCIYGLRTLPGLLWSFEDIVGSLSHHFKSVRHPLCWRRPVYDLSISTAVPSGPQGITSAGESQQLLLLVEIFHCLYTICPLTRLPCPLEWYIVLLACPLRQIAIYTHLLSPYALNTLRCQPEWLIFHSEIRSAIMAKS